MVRRKKKSCLLPLLVVILIIAFGWWYWVRAKSHFVHYPEFGIEIPRGYEVHGIDVSRYQDFIDWYQVKDMQIGDIHISFAFIKATEGLKNMDRHFKRNWRKAKDAGIARGAYHFFLPTKSGKAQAENFISRVKLENGDLPPVVDIEQAYGVSADKIRKEVKAFLDAVEFYYGVKPIIYTNVNFYYRYLEDGFEGYPLWVAHYLQRERPRIDRDWIFWQHSEIGRVDGILHKVDFNVFNGDSADFRKLLISMAPE